MDRNDFKFDELKMFFGEDYTARNGIIIRQPTIGDILEFGESDFYSKILTPWITNPTQYRLLLWKMDIDWNNISEFDLFLMLFGDYKNNDDVDILIPNVNLKTLELGERLKKETDEEGNHLKEVVLYNNEGLIISEDDYLEISQYLRVMFNIFPKTEKAKGKIAKESIIWEDEQKLMRRIKEGGGSNSTLLPLISACINHPGFKYKLNELKEVGICQFMDSVNRLQVYESTTALLGGMYSGFCDVSKVPNENFNFMRDLSKAK